MRDPVIQKILVAVDFSEMSEAALVHGRYLAKAFDAELKLLHVVQIPALAEAGAFLTPAIPLSLETEIRDRVLRSVEKKLGELAAVCGQDCRGVEAIILEGTPFERIVACAEELKADLIVVGTHGRSGLASRIIGSVAERVVRRAPCSVLCINPRSLAAIDAKAGGAEGGSA